MTPFRLVNLAATLALGACSSSVPDTFYALPSAPASTPNALPATYYAVVLPVQLPEALDRPQLVIHRDANQVVLLEHARWAGSLKGEIRQVLVRALARQGIRDVYGAPPPAGAQTYRVLLTLNTLTVSVAQPARWQATWSLRALGGKPAAVCSGEGDGPTAGVTATGAAESYHAVAEAIADRVADSLRRLAGGTAAPGCTATD